MRSHVFLLSSCWLDPLLATVNVRKVARERDRVSILEHVLPMDALSIVNPQLGGRSVLSVGKVFEDTS